MSNNKNYTGFEIAVIGMACRFPGAFNWKEYWNNLVNGVESVHFFSKEELQELGVDAETMNDKNFVPAQVSLERKESFDSFFFNYRPDDASLLNPEHRIFHECAWEALEDAGYDPDRTNGPIGLYAGAGEDLTWQLYSLLKNNHHIDGFTLGQLNNKDYLASLISYKLNLKGPAFSVNTACSTSLVAVHLACKSLLLGDARMVLAGGVTLRMQKQNGYFFQEGMISSVDGHCKAFDATASGTIGGEGAGIVVLKRLKDALADGDNIYAVIKGSATNNDGSRKVGYTAPSVEGQVECIRMAQKFAKVSPATIGYVEAHGTGTRLGDPIEVEALNIVFGNDKTKRCALGAVKTNIGHLDTAAGVAGLIKAVLCIKHKQIPPTLHFKNPNPEIDFDNGPFYITTQLTDWANPDGEPLRAGVSSFGIGGTNAHVVLEEAPIPEENAGAHEYKILTLSARTENSLSRYMNDLKNYLRNNDVQLADMAYTFQLGRKHFEYRNAIVFKEKEELIYLLGEEKVRRNIVRSSTGNSLVVFMFPGQGSQYIDMGRGLYEQEPAFRNIMDEGLSILKNITGTDFKKIWLPDDAAQLLINETRYTQPILFLFEYALARLMMLQGITPDYMIGHSIGEYVAACISGVFSFEDGLRLVTRRGELMGKLPYGSMLSIPMTADEAAAYLNKDISIAAINGPQQVVLSGSADAITEVMHSLDAAGHAYVKLHTSHAFHSAMQEPVMDELKHEAEKIQFGNIKIPFISNLTGALATETDVCAAGYWPKHLRNTVRFADGISTLLSLDKELVCIEVGPGYSLSSLVKQQHGKKAAALVNLVRHPKESKGDNRHFTECIGQLWGLGVNINWTAYYSGEKRRRASLPTYSFETIKYPVEVDPLETAMPADILHLTKKQELKDWIYYPVWKSAALQPSEKPAAAKGYLLFSFDKSFTQGLVQEGHELIEVVQGAGYEKYSRYSYAINPGNPQDFKTLVNELVNDGANITHIIYSWGIGVNTFQLDEENIDINNIFFALVHLTKNLLEAKLLSERKIILVTDRLYSVTGIEDISPASALLAGLLNVLPQEYSVTCCTVDIDKNELSPQLYERISYEINENENDRIVAIRHGKRWVREHVRNTYALNQSKPVFKKAGIYLITGGAGNLGLVLAKYITGKYQAKVVLTGRKKFVLLPDIPGLTYFSADVAKLQELKSVVDEVESTMGPIAGVIHAAGVTDHKYYELSEDISAANAFTIFAPKIKGIENIYELFKDRQPDFVLVTSSLAAVLGGLSYGAYSTANLYMDHFIMSICRQHPQWKSVQLAEMYFTEEDAAKEKTGARSALKPAEICELFEWCLHIKDQPVITETVEDLFARIRKVYEEKKEMYLDNQQPQQLMKAERPNLRNSFVAPETATEKEMVKMMEEFFGIRNIGVEDNFFELGGDSLKATIFIRRIEQAFKIKMSLADFFLAEHTRHVCDEIDEKLWINKSSENENQFVSII